MPPLSEPNAVGIVIAHGKRPSPPRPSTGKSSWPHWNPVTALDPVRKQHYVAFTILCRISCMVIVLWVFHRLPSEKATWLSTFSKFSVAFFPITQSMMGNNKFIQNYSLGSKSFLFHCWFVLRRWGIVLQVAWGMPSQWWSRMCISQMMGVTPGRRCWKDPTITPSWIPEASWWPLSTAAIRSMWLSMHELRSTRTVCTARNWARFSVCRGKLLAITQICAFCRTVGKVLEGITFRGTQIKWLCFFLWLPLVNAFCHL